MTKISRKKLSDLVTVQVRYKEQYYFRCFKFTIRDWVDGRQAFENNRSVALQTRKIPSGQFRFIQAFLSMTYQIFQNLQI